MVQMKQTVTPTEISVIFVTDDCNFPIGIAQCSKYYNKSVMYFNRLFVRPEYRRQGYGTKLLTMLLKLVKEQNFAIHLDINPYGDMNYTQLEQFYMKHGFIKCKDEEYGFDTYYYNKQILD